MKFFIDTADIAEIRDLPATGPLGGMTTSPSLTDKGLAAFLWDWQKTGQRILEA